MHEWNLQDEGDRYSHEPHSQAECQIKHGVLNVSIVPGGSATKGDLFQEYWMDYVDRIAQPSKGSPDTKAQQAVNRSRGRSSYTAENSPADDKAPGWPGQRVVQSSNMEWDRFNVVTVRVEAEEHG